MNKQVTLHIIRAPGSIWSICFSGLIALILFFILALIFGVSSLPPSEALAALLGKGNAVAIDIVKNVRLPRVLMAANTGAALALGGLAFQTVFRNPLAEPYILGISSGAAVGVVISILNGLSLFYSRLFAFTGGLGVLALVYLLGSRRSSMGLLLSGVMVNAFCSAMILFFVSLVETSDISSIMFWFMGNLGACTLEQAVGYSIFLLPGYIVLLLCGHGMNLLLLGEETAQSLGLAVQRQTFLLLFIASLMVSALVAAVGPLGFVGLVIPQALRRVFGHDHRRLAPACILYGAAFMVGCDLISRILPAQAELPSGVVTALIGAPTFIFLLRRMP